MEVIIILAFSLTVLNVLTNTVVTLIIDKIDQFSIKLTY